MEPPNGEMKLSLKGAAGVKDEDFAGEKGEGC
jgi:hypothetical protein